MRKKAKKENPLTTFRKLNKARTGKVMDSYPDPPNQKLFDKFQKTAETPLYDFQFTVPVGKAAGYTDNYTPYKSYKELKKSGEIMTRGQGNRARAAANIRQGFGNFAEKVKKVFMKKDPQMTTYNIIPLDGGSCGSKDPSCVRGGKGGRRAQKRRGQ